MKKLLLLLLAIIVLVTSLPIGLLFFGFCRSQFPRLVWFKFSHPDDRFKQRLQHKLKAKKCLESGFVCFSFFSLLSSDLVPSLPLSDSPVPLTFAPLQRLWD
jgi:hypothetical protein